MYVGFTYKIFLPVSGCVLTIGCSLEYFSPILPLLSISEKSSTKKFDPLDVCNAFLSIIISLIFSSSVSQASSIFENTVSPPIGGILIDLSIIVLHGVTS